MRDSFIHKSNNMKKLLLMAFVLFQGFVNAQAPTSGLIAYFPFNGNSLNSGSANITATLINISGTTNNLGVSNSAIQFAGNLNSLVDFTDNGNLDFTGSANFSICLAFNFTGSSTGGLFDNCLNYGGPGLWLWSTQPNVWNLQGNYKNNSVGSSAATSFPQNQWTHAVFMRNNGTISIYINGVLKLSTNEGILAPTYPINPICGAMGYGGFTPPRYNPYNGKMDELRIYNRALSAAEVTAVYNEYATGGTQPVTITCPSNITVANDAGQCGANVSYPAATATGTPAPTITYSNASGSFFGVGTTTVTATATNGTGSSATCSFTVTVTGGTDTDSDGNPDVCDTDDDNDGTADGSDCAPLDNTKWQQAQLYIDNDNDGYTNGQATVCYGATIPAGYKATSSGSDCNDNNNTVWRSESLFVDVDGDGYTNGQQTVCYGANMPNGYIGSSAGTDCNDNNSSVHPGATETCNDIDDDCDGLIDEGFINTIVTCPFTGTITRNLSSGCAYTVNGNEFNATVSQNCGPLGYTLTGATTGTGVSLAGIQLNTGATTVTWGATNANDQVFSCSFIVNVVPPFPTLTCPSNITVPATTGQCGAVVNYTTPDASQFCPGQNVAGSQTFSYTGSYQTFIIPQGVTSITIQAWGAQGAGTTGGRTGGNGGYATGNLAVTPGSTIYVYVGQQGQQTDAANLGYSSNAFNGGGRGWTWNNNYGRGGGGGGASDIRVGGNALTNRVIVAAGGGGATDNGCVGGIGGGLIGGNGGCNGSTGGTQTAGGTGGVSGGLGFGGDANSATTVGWVGGGGGGYYGGGCGVSHLAGAGGSSYIAGVTSGATTSGTQTGNGKVTISWQGAAQPSVDQLTGLASGSTFPAGTTTNTFRVTDAFGQTNTCSFTVTVNDEQAPAVVQPNNISVPNTAGQCSASINFSANASDNCSVTSLKYYLYYNTANQEEISFPKTFAMGSYQVTVAAKDAANNTTIKQFTITVNDEQKPNVVAGIIGSCYQTVAAAEAAALEATTYTDNCSSSEELDVTVSTEGTCSAVITVTVTDASNNSKSVTYNTKIDNTAPVLSSTPADITVSCQSVPVVPGVTASDNCDGAVSVTFVASNTQGSDPAQSNYYNYTITRKWSASDGCGNTVEHTQIITVQDITAPILTCPPNKVVSNETGLCSAQVSINASSSDNCSTPTVKYYLYYGTPGQQEISSPHTFAVGSYTVKVISTDPAGNSNDCAFTVTVNDAEKPTVTKGSIASCYKTVAEAEAAALAATTYTDNCTPDAQLNVGIATVGTCSAEITVTVTDASNNSRPVVYNTKIDNTAPVLSSTPPGVTVNCQSVPVVPAVTASDNCDGAVNVTFSTSNTQGSDPALSSYYNYTITRKWSAADGCGNAVEHTQTITVQDITAPGLTCPADKVVSNEAGLCSARVSFSANSSDNCSTPTVKYYLYYGTSEQQEIGSPYTFAVGSYSIKVISTDPAGNSNDCTFSITVNDTEKPTVTKGIIGSCYKTVAEAESAALAATTSSDNCTPNAYLNITAGTVGTCSAVITVTVKDAANNSRYVTYNTRIDNTSPVLSATPSDVTVNCQSVPVVPAVTASDNCDGAVTVSFSTSNTQGSDATQSNYYNYTITRKWSASDGCGNTTGHTQTITVQDITAPGITCPPDKLNVPFDFGQLYATIAVGSATATDNCAGDGNISIAGRRSDNAAMSGQQYPLGTTIVSWSATDPSNNSSACTQTISVRKRATTVTYTGPMTNNKIGVQYSDIINLQAKLTDNEGLATPNNISGRTITFQLLNGTTVLRSKNATTDPNGIANDTFKVEQAPGSYIIKAIFAGDSYYSGCYDQDNCDINQEDAIVEYNGSQYFTTPSPTNMSGSVTLAAAINDINDGADKRGDIRKAKATFRDGGPGGNVLGSANLPVGLITPGILTDGLSAATQAYTLNSNEAAGGGKIFQVWVGTGDHYTGADAGPTPVTLALPGQDFVTGGGHLVLTNSAGTYAGTTNSKMNFGFTMKWNKSGKNLQGQINIVFRKWQSYNGEWQWRVYQIKSNAINSMAVVEVGSNGQPASATNPAAFRKAIINTKANLKDVTDPLNNIDLGGNHNLVLEAIDHITANGGTNDKISVMIMGSTSNELLFSSSWVSNATVAQTITGGNINVRNAGGSSSATKNTVNRTAEMESTPVDGKGTFSVKAYPNPSAHQFALIVNSNSNESVQIQLYDASGRLIETINARMNEPARFGEKLKAGIYIAKVMQGIKTETIKLIKQ